MSAEADMEVPFASVEAWCREQGLLAVAAIDPPEALDPTGLDRMLADGIGDMTYLQDHRELRLHPRRLAPGSRSLVVGLLPYATELEPQGLKRARYARGKDYHKLLRRRLAAVGRTMDESLGIPLAHRATVDSAPVNERQLAGLAGLGWLARNALLIREGVGSYCFIGCLFTAAMVERRHGGQGTDRCGSCRACVDRCPTDAIVDGRVLSERCISYLTIEHHGVVPRELATRFEGWWFGCDLCQSVCPWNRFAPGPGDPRLRGAGGDPEAELLAIGPADFDRYFAGRAIRRIGYERFRRNLLLALWSLDRMAELRPLLAEGLPLVVAQARELGVDPSPTGA